LNRVFSDKSSGLVVDYLGLAEELKQALADYTNSKNKGDITLDQEETVAVMLEKYEQVCAILHGLLPGSVVAQIRPAAPWLLGRAVELRSIRSRYRVWAVGRNFVPWSR
jgi:type I restriction enzyme R subunit